MEKAPAVSVVSNEYGTAFWDGKVVPIANILAEKATGWTEREDCIWQTVYK